MQREVREPQFPGAGSTVRAAMNRRPPISPVSTAIEIASRSSSGDQPRTVVHPEGIYATACERI